MVKKVGVLLLTIILIPLLSGVYGILHDQISYSISPEYFTKFKFEQFGFWTYKYENERMAVSVVGFLATWWTGLLIGIVIGMIGLTFPNAKQMWKGIYEATIRILGIVIVTGFLGVFVGKFVISNIDGNWVIPGEVIDKESFLTVGTMHTLSYLGGLIGLIFGVRYQLRQKRKQKID